ncbi:N-6 DNA methylase [Endozoicomonas sp. ONNA2]|uniref:N-6 DNA methylase n=1 Tax=Endozoicomonas sp. ONNA2 TaxID=2828741 RepID=UPI0021494990|nr:N-6 DNA methylase [Endozoicomonas sp. ONNA2]
MDDSNAKLDEVSKVIAVCIAAQNNWINAEEFNDLVRTSKHDNIAVDVLNRAFETCKTLPKFINTDGTSIFGSSSKLNIQTTDHEFALKLVRTIHGAFSRAVNHVSEDSSFDLINEAFGHFVRDNFRGNIEDAQYMTPPEVVDFICDWAISELALDGFKFNIESLKILDPSCGVGSFLASFYRKLTAYLNDIPEKINLIGQDKVDRMVRLSKINMMLFGSNVFDIEQGNSLIDSHRLDNLNGKVDLILTNPPFGANISFDKLNSQPKDNYPLLHGSYSTSRNVDSELAFIDRELALLKDGGKLFIVVPDSTISSRGLAETLRIRIQGIAKLKGVVELPSVAFAQAGTRTKTSILYLEKCTTRCFKTDLVTMATISDLGFQVSSRKGVAVKKYDGVNELVLLGEKLFYQSRVKGIVSETPSCTIETYANIKDASWTASHYSAKRVKAVKEIEEMPGFEARLLSELGDCETKKRRRLKEEPGSKCISVLHIIGDGILDFNELFTYEPKTKGNVCYEGDILLSKINPRIPRVIVIPELDFPTTCSNEFEIIRAREGIDPYWLCFMLLEKVVQGQIQSLTSGTSSSHNRIKTAELEMVKIPFPVSQDMDKRMKEAASRYRKYVNNAITSLLSINDLRQSWYKVYIPTGDRGNEVLSVTACA